MNIVRKYELTEEEKKALIIVNGILNCIRHRDYDHFNEDILANCELDEFYRDYEYICKELIEGEN